MTLKKRISIISGSILSVALICLLIFHNAATPTTGDIPPTEKKAELQEQLADELQKYYMGTGNYQDCQKLIEEINQYQ